MTQEIENILTWIKQKIGRIINQRQAAISKRDQEPANETAHEQTDLYKSVPIQICTNNTRGLLQYLPNPIHGCLGRMFTDTHTLSLSRC